MTFLLENPYTILIIASMLGFFMAWGIGANHVANGQISNHINDFS